MRRVQLCDFANICVTRMCARYGFEKPNDRRALDVMNAAAKAVVSDLPEITIAYGVSDEFRYSLSSAMPHLESNST